MNFLARFVIAVASMFPQSTLAFDLSKNSTMTRQGGSTDDAPIMSVNPHSNTANSTVARSIADRATSAFPLSTNMDRFGTSPYPFAQNSISTIGSTTNASTSLSVLSVNGVHVGDMILANGVPVDTQVAKISSNTITMTKAATATASKVPVKFGVDRWSSAASVVVNTLGAQNIYVGSAARGRSTILSQMGAGGHDYPQVSALTSINPYGGVSATFANRMSDESTGLGAIITEEVLTDVDSMPIAKNSWSRYTQGITRSTIKGYHLGEENSIANFWPITDVDPWNINPPGRVTNLRIDSGIGSGPGAIYNPPNPVSAFIDMVNNGSSARVGINVGSDALDTTRGRIAPFVQMPPLVSLTWYQAVGKRAMDIYSGPNGDLALSAYNDNGTINGAPSLVIVRGTKQVQIPNVGITGGTIGGTSITLQSYTVATLPKCNTGTRGTMVVATDVSDAPTYRQTGMRGGGSVAVPVFCNGSAYEAH